MPDARAARRLALVIVLAAVACGRGSRWVAMPEQKADLPESSDRRKAFITMADASATLHMINDINPVLEGQNWRWTRKCATLRFLIEESRDLRFVARFAIPEATFQQTGPVRIVVRVDGKVLNDRVYSKPGQQELAVPVPKGWLSDGAEPQVEMEIDKLYVADADGAQLGFVLSAVGFTR